MRLSPALMLMMAALPLAACSNPRRDDGNEAEIVAAAQALENRADAAAEILVNEIEAAANEAAADAQDAPDAIGNGAGENAASIAER